MLNNDSIKIALLGSYRISDGYPNVKWLIEWMKVSPKIKIVYGKTTTNIESSSGIFYQSRKSKISFIIMILNMLITSIKSLAYSLYLFQTKKIDLVYAPYPAHISLFLLSFLPKIIRPPVIVDAFISLYDTAILDRKLFNEGSLIAKLILWFEKRALASANKIIVDTKCSAKHLSKLLKINADKIINLPLMTDENSYILNKYNYNNNPIVNVLFIGTFVPLQGVEIIADAATILANRKNIKFIFVGNGQTADLVMGKLHEKKANITWHKEWQSPESINKLIQDADICLGIFGDSKKAARVWPLKNYTSMCIGRAIISQETKCLPMKEHSKPNPFYPVPSNDPRALANSIEELALSPALRKKYALSASQFYKQHLNNDTIFKKYLNLFAQI